jgi:hypothetical protein
METIAEEFIGRIERSYTDILRLCHNIPEAILTERSLPNGWSVKDTLAHIAAWEWRCASLLCEAHDTDAPLKANPAVDALNIEIYQERRDWSWAEAENDFRDAHAALIESIRDLPPDRLKDPLIQRSIAEETWEHYESHLHALQQWHEQLTWTEVIINR